MKCQLKTNEFYTELKTRVIKLVFPFFKCIYLCIIIFNTVYQITIGLTFTCSSSEFPTGLKSGNWLSSAFTLNVNLSCTIVLTGLPVEIISH